jgi:hypothetical protein
LLTLLLSCVLAVLRCPLLQGHSIGGAMAVMLMIMFRRRGVLGPQQIAPVYTFGAPAIFCDGALGTCSACITQPDGSESCSLVSDVESDACCSDH